MKRYYCTLFDKNYLPHVLTLIDSLNIHADEYLIYCFCMDNDSYNYLTKERNSCIVPIAFNNVEDLYPELLIAKSNRTKVEYYFTCSSAICSYVFDTSDKIDIITYLDADLYFFSSPEPIYQELEDASVGIIEHKFYGIGKRYEKYGKFNVGWVSFRNDNDGRKCLSDWMENCLTWCYDRLENGKFGDQKYLDDWKGSYNGVKIISHLGANLAPWNVGQYRLTNSSDGKVLVNSFDVIFYHFASFKQIDMNEYVTNVSKYFVPLTGVLRKNIYLPYVESLKINSFRVGITFIKKDRSEYKQLFNIFHIKELSRYIRKVIYQDTIKF